MQEHLFFSIPDLSNGAAAALNGVLLPAQSADPDFFPFSMEPKPWDYVCPEFVGTLRLPSGTPILDLLRMAGYEEPDPFEDLGGGIWYLNSRSERAYIVSNTRYIALCGDDDNPETIREDRWYELTRIFGKDTMSSVRTFEDLSNAFNSGHLEAGLRAYRGLPDIPANFVVDLNRDEDIWTLRFNDGSEFPPFISDGCHAAWEWMGTTTVSGEAVWGEAITAIGDAIGDPRALEKNLHWIQQYF